MKPTIKIAWLMFFFLAIWNAPAVAAEAVPLHEAVTAGKVKARITGLGGSTGDSIEIALRRQTSENLRLTLASGTVFKSRNGQVQNMAGAVIKGERVTATTYAPSSEISLTDDSEHVYIVESYCMDFHKDNPTENDVFEIMPPDERSASLLRAGKETLANSGVIQAALWMDRDKASGKEIQARFPVDDRDLANARALLDKLARLDRPQAQATKTGISVRLIQSAVAKFENHLEFQNKRLIGVILEFSAVQKGETITFGVASVTAETMKGLLVPASVIFPTTDDVAEGVTIGDTMLHGSVITIGQEVFRKMALILGKGGGATYTFTKPGKFQLGFLFVADFQDVRAVRVLNQSVPIRFRTTEAFETGGQRTPSQSASKADQHPPAIIPGSLTNSVISLAEAGTQKELGQMLGERDAQISKLKTAIAQRDARIAELEAEKDSVKKRLDELNMKIQARDADIQQIQRKLVSGEGDRELLLKGLKSLQADKSELEREFNDLAILRAQSNKLKDELSISRRLDWIRRGMYPAFKGPERRTTSPPQSNNFELNVELKSDGSVRIPASNADRGIAKSATLATDPNQTKTAELLTPQQSSGNKEDYVILGNASVRRGEYEKAIEYYDKAIAINSNFPEAYVARGAAHAFARQYDKAIEDYNIAIAIKPNLAQAYHNRGIAYGEKAQYAKAIDDYSRAIRLDPKPAQSYIMRAATYSINGRNDKAIEDCDEALALDGNSAEAYTTRGAAYADDGQYEKARSDFERACNMGNKKGCQLLQVLLQTRK